MADHSADSTHITSIDEQESLSEIEAGTPGAGARSPLKFPPKAWWAIIKRLYVMNDFHNLPLLAAGVAFFSFLASRFHRFPIFWRHHYYDYCYLLL